MSDQLEIEKDGAKAAQSSGTPAPLYAARKKIFPRRVSGSFRRFKWLVMLVTLAIYYLTPWIRWERGPYAPDQAVLIDIANRRFYFLWIEIWPQEFFFVAGLLVMAGIGLFLITSTVGRAWCGYTCPQTVWVDLFLVVERWVEGDRNARMKLDAAPWGARKLLLRTTTHSIWILISVLTGGAWIFYFADAPQLLIDVVTGDAATVAYATIAVLTATTYILGGLMREQVCTYMCPWPRIQAAMLDDQSLTVTYNDWRGEPRSRHAKKALAEGKSVGDCVDCDACVVVCPMGIDIRDGQQLPCITCALCIDACNAVMTKLGKERSLISYATLADYNANMALATAGGTKPIDPGLVRVDGKLSEGVAHFHLRKLFRLRTFLYFAAWGLVGLAMLFALMIRDRIDLNVLHDRNPQFVVLSDGSIRNGYTVKLLNMIPQPRSVTLRMEGLPGATMSISGMDHDDGVSATVELDPDRLKMLRVYVRQEREHVGQTPSRFTFIVEDDVLGERDEYVTIFTVPER